MADRQALTVNDVVVSKAHEGHQLLIVTADAGDRLSLLYRGHQWSVPYAVARGARLAGRKGGHLWYTTDDATFDYLDTFRGDPSGVASDSTTLTRLGHTRRADGRIPSLLTRPAGRGRRARSASSRLGSDQWV